MWAQVVLSQGKTPVWSSGTSGEGHSLLAHPVTVTVKKLLLTLLLSRSSAASWSGALFDWVWPVGAGGAFPREDTRVVFRHIREGGGRREAQQAHPPPGNLIEKESQFENFDAMKCTTPHDIY